MKNIVLIGRVCEQKINENVLTNFRGLFCIGSDVYPGKEIHCILIFSETLFCEANKWFDNFNVCTTSFFFALDIFLSTNQIRFENELCKSVNVILKKRKNEKKLFIQKARKNQESDNVVNI